MSSEPLINEACWVPWVSLQSSVCFPTQPLYCPSPSVPCIHHVFSVFLMLWPLGSRRDCPVQSWLVPRDHKLLSCKGTPFLWNPEPRLTTASFIGLSHFRPLATCSNRPRVRYQKTSSYAPEPSEIIHISQPWACLPCLTCSLFSVPSFPSAPNWPWCFPYPQPPKTPPTHTHTQHAPSSQELWVTNCFFQ